MSARLSASDKVRLYGEETGELSASCTVPASISATSWFVAPMPDTDAVPTAAADYYATASPARNRPAVLLSNRPPSAGYHFLRGSLSLLLACADGRFGAAVRAARAGANCRRPAAAPGRPRSGR